METSEPRAQRASELFEGMGGTIVDGFPAIHSPVHHTRSGTAYLKIPGVIMLARPRTNVAGLAGFLEGFDPELGFPAYLDDPTQLPDSSQLCKTAGQTCFDEDTEILTDEGWKPFADLNREELVLTMNPRSGRAEFQRPVAYQRFDYDGFMLGFESSSLSFLITPDHRQWAKTHGSTGYRFHKAWEIANRNFLVKAASEGWQGTIPSSIEIPGFDFSQRLSNHTGEDYGTRATSVPPIRFDKQEEIRALALLCVYYATEGSLQKGEGEGVVIYGDHVDGVEEVAGILGLKPHAYVDKRNGCPRVMVHGGKGISRFFEKECGKGSQNKKLPVWMLNLPSDWLQEIWDLLVKTNGHVQKHSGTQYLVTTSKTLAGQAQEILCKLGYGSRIRENKKVEGRLQIYSVCRKTRNQIYVNRGSRVEGKHYRGNIYCVTTENGIIFVRRNGKPHFSGNCYASFGPRRTTNENAAAYFERLTSAGHGSVLEHANFSFLLYGVSRSVTHELVRHRAGVGFCLTGDTLIYSDHFCNGRREGVKKRSMAQLYEMTKTLHGRSRLKLLRPRSLDEATGTFTQGRVKTVACSGVKPVFKVELEDGKTITCSKDHHFLTPDGWKSLRQITNGLEVSSKGFAVHGPLDTEILVNGVTAYKDRDWLTQQYIERNRSITEVADLARVSTTTLKKWLRKYGLKKPLGMRTRWTFANEGKLYADRAWLEEQYVFNGLDQASIAQLIGVSRHTIRAWVRKHGLQKRMGSWSVGRTPWNKGKRYKAGWNHTPEMRQRLAEHKRGEKNPQWKGGVTKDAITTRRGVEGLRPRILERDRYRCRLCGVHSKRLDMHHIIPVWARPDLVLEPDNIATVCRSCHLGINGREMEYAERFGRTPGEADLAKSSPRARGRLFVPRAKRIKSVTYAGEQMTYDLEMEGPNHNFVANGIVTHNSQISQRYVSGSVLRFVERPEYQDDEELHRLFEERADRAAAEYGAMADRLLERQEGGNSMLSADYKTDARKKVQQTARSLLPNETEAPMVFTGNVRALRHIIEMRADAHAESEIRNLAVRIFLCLVTADPILFGDYSITELPDGTFTVTTTNRKA